MRTERFGHNGKVLLHGDGKPDFEIIREISQQRRVKNQEEPYFLVDLQDVVKKCTRWNKLLPRVKPFYAVKCNPDIVLLRLLAHLGLGFDCASKEEIARVMKLGVDPSRIIYAHTCKQQSHIRYAADQGVDLMTFDNEVELFKIKEIYPDARLVFRILPPKGLVMSELGNKFGCKPAYAHALLSKARELELNVVGISFHVGWYVLDARGYVSAIETAAKVCETAELLGFHMELLDIGGGFPGLDETGVGFKEIANTLNESLDKNFPPERNIRIMAEPGTYIAESAFTLTATVIGKRCISPPAHKDKDNEDNEIAQIFMYYINDGLYGSFRSRMYDKLECRIARPVHPPTNPNKEFQSVFWGQSCHDEDRIVVNRSRKLPELQVGDSVSFPNQGDYTVCMITAFSGFPHPHRYYCCSQSVWDNLFPHNTARKDSSRAASMRSELRP